VQKTGAESRGSKRPRAVAGPSQRWRKKLHLGRGVVVQCWPALPSNATILLSMGPGPGCDEQGSHSSQLPIPSSPCRPWANKHHCSSQSTRKQAEAIKCERIGRPRPLLLLLVASTSSPLRFKAQDLPAVANPPSSTRLFPMPNWPRAAVVSSSLGAGRWRQWPLVFFSACQLSFILRFQPLPAPSPAPCW